MRIYHGQLTNHAHQQLAQNFLPAMLPLFPDDSKSVSMIRHSMDMIKNAVQELNPGQITFELAKHL